MTLSLLQGFGYFKLRFSGYLCTYVFVYMGKCVCGLCEFLEMALLAWSVLTVLILVDCLVRLPSKEIILFQISSKVIHYLSFSLLPAVFSKLCICLHFGNAIHYQRFWYLTIWQVNMFHSFNLHFLNYESNWTSFHVFKNLNIDFHSHL